MSDIEQQAKSVFKKMREDIEYLHNIAEMMFPVHPEKGLVPEMYVTSVYEEDVRVYERIKKIAETYGIRLRPIEKEAEQVDEQKRLND